MVLQDRPVHSRPAYPPPRSAAVSRLPPPSRAAQATPRPGPSSCTAFRAPARLSVAGSGRVSGKNTPFPGYPVAGGVSLVRDVAVRRFCGPWSAAPGCLPAMGWSDGSAGTSARRESSCGDGRCCREIRSEARARCTVRCPPSRPRNVCRDHFVVREHVSAGRYVVVASRPVRPAESLRRTFCRGGPPNPRSAARTRHTSRCVPPRLCRCVW